MIDLFTTISEALTYIHSRPRLHRSNKLDVMTTALDLFEQPQHRYPTIHITGTNGKGTTSQLVSELLVAHGFHVGLFVSPFIINFNERIQIDNQPIADDVLLALVNQTKAVLDQAELALTEFEFVTVLMFQYFAKEQVDVGVIEVGIGGTHDRTNVINAEIGAITAVGLDHEELIGPTIADIAYEKAGIIKSHQQTFLGDMIPEVTSIIENRLLEQQATGYWLNQEIQFSKVHWTPGQVQFDWVWQGAKQTKLVHLSLPALAQWQLDDAGLSLSIAACFLQNRESILDPVLTKRVLRQFQVVGRLEIISQEPLILIDGAHNIAAIKTLIATIKHDFKQLPVYLIIGMMADKDIEQVAKLVQATSWQVIWTTVADNPRAATKAQLIDNIDGNFSYAQNWRQALQAAFSESGGDGLYLVAGSFYLVSDVRKAILAENVETRK